MFHERQQKRIQTKGYVHMGSIERATDSSLAKFIARIVFQTMLLVIGWFLVQTNSQIQNAQTQQFTRQEQQSSDIALIKSDVRDLNTRLTAQVLRQVDSNTQSINKLNDRVQVIERGIRMP